PRIRCPDSISTEVRCSKMRDKSPVKSSAPVRLTVRGRPMQPLEGIRIADFSHIMAGPYATHLLRLLGAEVIKVEAPGRGDALRNYGSDRAYDGMAPAFIAVNAGKKSMSLDLKHAASQEAARRLIARCDVVVENFRPGVMARLGLGFVEARALK